MTGNLEVFKSADDLERGAAGRIVGILNQEIESRKIATIAVSGGSTPKSVYRQLGTRAFSRTVDWTKVHVFWGDERCVPPSSPESNYRMVKEALLVSVAIPEKNVHRILGETPPRDAALHYERGLEEFFGLAEDQFPMFDLVLLGLGEDGHIASLFPSDPGVQEQTRLAIEVFVARLAQYRITLTLPVFNNARSVLFIVSGANKANIVREVLENDTSRYPAQLVKPRSGHVAWLVDQDAASHLHKQS